MVGADLHDFFLGSAGVAGALIGLLFVAISVAGERLSSREVSAPIHRIRAAAALTAFMNTLTVSLFALLPGQYIAWTAVAVAATGIGFILASLLALARFRLLWSRRVRDALFLVGLAIVFVIQLLRGLEVARHPGNAGAVNDIAILVIICFLLGIYRAWDLIGGPSFGVGHELFAMFRMPPPSAETEDSTE